MSIAAVAVLATVVLHFAWEMLQAPAFVDFAGSTWGATLRCLAATGGDLLLATGAYAITAVVFRRAAWPVQHRSIQPAATWIALGVVATIAFDQRALAEGRWACGPEMPVIVGIGLLPLLQWRIGPGFTLAAVPYVAARRELYCP